MARLTRAQSQARTRERLVATARQMFLHDGYHATSLDKVADTAGFSKGAVYSNFRNKDELCLAVLDDIHAGHIEEIAALVVGKTPDGAVTALAEWAERMVGDEGWTMLEVEFAVHAHRDPGLRAELAARDKAVRGAIEALARDWAERTGPAGLPPADLATALLSLGIGLGIQRVIDPGIPVRVLTDTLRALLAAPDRQPT
ncbi:TetR/AcrR family transcriptional regulator [Actinokineospora sp. UTMC 2448]|uniref:TetR/AcrR family transcriptional regulator n=1 Tax=Actinokineospora sp. UTMC 2448 TaxID=2268449 RepID=UPI0021647A2A|nr:TetR/AcrR family transcriptional regulator [Actinokineospora sp. UTMC 2448]UVS77417.1 Toluene efflux pump ttgABC operon repressor [Actinokineospora sp. UTMC 2448]